MTKRSIKYFRENKWITKGYTKVILPLEISWDPSIKMDLTRDYRDVLQFPISSAQFCEWANKNWSEVGAYTPSGSDQVSFHPSEEYLRREREGLLFTELLDDE